MKSLFKKALVVALINLVVFVLLIVASNSASDMETGLVLLLIIPGVMLILQFIVGVILAIRDSSREYGQAILLGVGVIFLLGLSFCGFMAAMGSLV